MEPDAGAHVTPTAPSTASFADALNVATAPDAPVAAIVLSAGTVTTGAVVSRTVTLKDCGTAGLPARSAAAQVTIVVPTANVEPEAGAHFTATVTSTLSLADGLNVATAPVAFVAVTVMFAGTETIGAVVSITATMNDAVLAWPPLSVALQATVVLPRRNVDPLAGAQIAATGPSTRSIADALNVATAPEASTAETVTVAGTVTAGGVVSRTVTLNAPVLVLPA
jgi:hypothetical protein